jgi:hypothetical protein
MCQKFPKLSVRDVISPYSDDVPNFPLILSKMFIHGGQVTRFAEQTAFTIGHLSCGATDACRKEKYVEEPFSPPPFLQSSFQQGPSRFANVQKLGEHNITRDSDQRRTPFRLTYSRHAVYHAFLSLSSGV